MIQVIEFTSREELNVWLNECGDNVKVLNVATTKRWSPWTGFLGDTKSYTVTYEQSPVVAKYRPGSASPPAQDPQTNVLSGNKKENHEEQIQQNKAEVQSGAAFSRDEKLGIKRRRAQFSIIGGTFVGIALLVVIFAFLSKGRLQNTWNDPKVPMTVSFSNSGQIAIGNQDGYGVEFIDPNSGNFIHKYSFSFPHVRSIAFSKDGSLIAIGGGETFGAGGIALWNLHSDTVANNVSVEGEVDQVDFSPDGRLLAFTSSDKFVRLLNLQSGALETLSGHLGEVLSVGFSPNSDLLASGSTDHTVRLWNVRTRETVRVLPDCYSEIAFSPDGKTLATNTSEPGVVMLFKVDTGEVMRKLSGSGNKYEIRKLAFFKDSKTLVVAGGDSTTREAFYSPSEIRIYDTISGNLKYVLKGHKGQVIDLSLRGDSLVSCGPVMIDSNTVSGEVKLWDISDR